MRNKCPASCPSIVRWLRVIPDNKDEKISKISKRPSMPYVAQNEYTSAAGSLFQQTPDKTIQLGNHVTSSIIMGLLV